MVKKPHVFEAPDHAKTRDEQYEDTVRDSAQQIW